MGKIGIIISREYSTRVKKKSFILTTLLVPILIAAMIAVPALIAFYSQDDKEKTIAVVDKSGVVANNLESSKSIKYVVVSPELGSEIKKDLDKSDKYYALLEIGELDTLSNSSLSIYANEQVNITLSEKIQNDVNYILKYNKLQSYEIPNLEEVMNNVQSESTLKTFQVSSGEDEDKETSVVPYMAIGYISSFFIYMFIFMFGSMVMRGVIEEKNNRIVEVIVSSVKPIELMIGKIVGIALVAITQFVIWIALTLLIVFSISSVAGTKSISQITQAQQEVVAASSVAPTEEVESMVENATSSNMMDTIFTTLSQMNILGIVATFLLYFVFGYLLYSSMFAAVGSAVDNEADTQQLMLPITLPLILGLFIMMNAFTNPNSSLAVWGSIIPFTSPMVMVARFAYGVPAWQYILSIVLLVATFLLMAWISAKIYRIGILSYGKKASWKDIFKWIKFKD